MAGQTDTSGYLKISLASGGTISGTQNFSGVIGLANGAVGSPSLAFTNDAGNDTGFYLIGANNFGLTVAGTKEVDFNTTSTIFTKYITAPTTVNTINGLIINAGTISGIVDSYTSAWADYSGSSTVTGYSAFTTKEVYVKKNGKTVFCRFNLTGTSNLTTISFTLAYTTSNDVTASTVAGGYAEDNGVAQTLPCGVFLNKNTSTIQIFKDCSTANAWTNSGNKQATGIFWFEATA